MSRKQKNRVGVIGLGQIGSKVSAGLRSAGFSVYVWNRSPKAEPNFLGTAIEVADLCDTIQLFVPDDAALDSVVRTIAAALRPSHIIIASTTTTPGTARELGAIVESAGARYLDAPFAGCRADAETRQLVYYVGGSESAIKDARPVLQATSRSIVPVGAIGDASQLKLALQMLTAITLEGLSEALSFVRAGGLKPEALLDALEQDPTRSAFVSEKLAAMVKGNFENGMPIRHLFRDLQLALKIGGSNPNVPATGVVAGLLFGAMKRGWATSDGAIVSRVFEPDVPPAPVAAAAEAAPAESAIVEAAKADPVPAEKTPTEEESAKAAAEVGLQPNGVAEMPAVETPKETPVEPPARSGVIPEKHGGGGINRLRRGLELIRTTPVIIRNSLKPTTTPPPPAGENGGARAKSATSDSPAPAAAASAPPADEAKSPKAPVEAAPPTAPVPIRAGLRPPPTVSIPPPSAMFPAEPPESPNFPANLPHRLNRRLNDTTNLQALLRSESGAPAPTSPIPIPADPDAKMETVGEAEIDSPGAEEPAMDEPEEITAEVLPPLSATPVIAPVIPGDIRPTQRVPLRASEAEAVLRPRMVRDPKSRSWIHRLIGG